MADVFTLTLTGEQEAPAPVATDASGTGMVAWDGAALAAAYEVTVRGLDFGPVLGMEPQTADPADDVTLMHVHNAPRGVAGPVVFGQIGPTQDADDVSLTLNADGSWTVRGVWEATDPANVSIEAFADELTAAAAGSEVALYFNVHSTSFPAGEIRGQWVASDAEAGGDEAPASDAEAGGDASTVDTQGPPGDDVPSPAGAEDSAAGGRGYDVPVAGGGDHFGSADRDTFVVFPGGNLDIFPAETELFIDAGPSQHRFAVELAETIQQLSLGLMFREDLAEGRGMLFDFGFPQAVAFYMRNTFVPLDIIFIGADGTVANVAERTVPLSEENIPSGQPVRAVLEVPAGTAATLGIGIGDRVLHPIFGTADPAAGGGGNALLEVAPGDDSPLGAGAGDGTAGTQQGGDTPSGGNDTVYDFTRGEDVIDLRLFGAVRPVDFDTNGDGVLDGRDTPLAPADFGVLTFAALDTTGDGVLDGGDAPVAITAAGDTVIRLPPASDPAGGGYTLTLAGVAGLAVADFLFLA